ncbi:MAG: serine hydrolase domain-containing protein, partial [Pseudomonadota bacterium]
MLNPILFFVVSLFFFSQFWTSAIAQETPQTLEELDQKLQQVVDQAKLPGASIAVVEGGELIFTKGYGLADVKAGKPVMKETLFKAGSTSKNITSLLALILSEEGRIDLTAPLSQYLPDIGLKNPYEATHPLRLVHLLEHTAGLEGSTYNEYASSQANMSPTEYAYLLGPKLKVRWVPGFYFSYANSGHTLAAAAMEQATGKDFDTLVREKIFAPLGMVNSYFSRDQVDMDQLSMSYANDGQTEQPHWDMLIRPSGSLITTAADLAQIVKLYANRGRRENGEFLTTSALVRMETPYTSAMARAGQRVGGYGLGNFGFFEGPHLFQGHWGATEGFRTHMGYMTEGGGGYVVMANADEGTSHQLRGLISSYLTRALPAPLPLELDVPLQDITPFEGWYRPISESMVLRSWLWATFGAVHLRQEETGIVLDPVLPWLSRQSLEAAGGSLYRFPNIGVPTVGLVQGPEGEPVLVNDMAYEQVGWAQAVLPFYLLVLGILVALTTLLYSLWWVPVYIFGKFVMDDRAITRFSLFLGGGS